MKADLIIKNIDNLITLRGPNRARVKKEMREIGLIKNGVIAIKGDKIIYVGEINYLRILKPIKILFYRRKG